MVYIYFCIQVETDDAEANAWYLYCNIKYFAGLFAELKDNTKVAIKAKCNIHTSQYQNNQDYLAKFLMYAW